MTHFVREEEPDDGVNEFLARTCGENSHSVALAYACGKRRWYKLLDEDTLHQQ